MPLLKVRTTQSVLSEPMSKSTEQQGAQPSDSGYLRDAADNYLRECFRRETPPHVGELAAQLRVSIYALARRFRADLGLCPSLYLKSAQLRHAQQLLRTSTLSLNAIGYRSGFGTRMSFYRAFKRGVGVTPASFRRR
jgi:AraC-like DNA-binding protein